jgi:hypothetical protein
MRLPPRASRAALVALAVTALGCGGDGGGGASDGGPVDGGDDGRPDAEDLCPGQLTVEGHVFDLVSGENRFGVTVAEHDAPASSATSAPNGRVMLCVDRAAEVVLRVTGAGDAERVDRVSAAEVGRFRAAGHAHPFGVMTTADLAALATELGAPPPDGSTTWAIVHVLSLPAGGALLGATVGLDVDHGGGFSRQADGSFVAGSQVAAGGAVLFVEVPITSAPSVIVTPPAGFAGDCTGPSTLFPALSAVSGAAHACE